jgi:very-long-chain (3R)-3-hydroxyacyl-CoA dehydratase
MLKKYLIGYNVVLFLAWSLFFAWQITHGFVIDKISITILNIAQVAALLEILHSKLGWVKSPVFTTALQISSRVFVLFWLNVIPYEHQILLFGISGITIVSIAWSITEMVRYSYYTFSLLNKEIKFLTFLRYTLFIVLYPLGITGEGMIMASVLKWNNYDFSLINIIIFIVILSYLPFFPKLYGYMWQQRKKKF